MEHCVLRSKVFHGAECSSEQNVLRSKMFWGAKYESAKSSQGVKCSGEHRPGGAKCVSAYVQAM